MKKRYVVGVHPWGKVMGRRVKNVSTLEDVLKVSRGLWHRGQPYVFDVVSCLFAWPGMYKRWQVAPAWRRK